MKKLKTFIFSVLAGICIGMGAVVNLSCDNKVIGALFFTLGLFIIVTNGFNLFTGKVCYVFDNPIGYTVDCAVIWLGNLVGTCAAAFCVGATRIGQTMTDKSRAIVDIKLNDEWYSLLILGFFCNILIYIAVDGFKNNEHQLGKYLALFLGVAAFILCSYEHCVADMFYFAMAGEFSVKALLCLGIITLGNILGGVFMPLCKKLK